MKIVIIWSFNYVCGYWYCQTSWDVLFCFTGTALLPSPRSLWSDLAFFSVAEGKSPVAVLSPLTSSPSSCSILCELIPNLTATPILFTDSFHSRQNKPSLCVCVGAGVGGILAEWADTVFWLPVTQPCSLILING